MRRFSSGSLFGIALILFFTTLWSACGGGSSNNNSSFTITKFVFAPSLISLEPGQVATISATPYNSSGTVVSATVTYTSSDSKNADITQGGSLCAGQWDNTHTVCTPSYQSGQFTVTATANGATGKATVYVHFHVDAVYLHGPGSACTTMGKTAGLTPYACTTLADSRGTCTVGTCADNTSMCDITDQIGGFNYNVLDSTVASIDSTGKLTAGAPGITKIYASVSSGSTSATSSAIPYTTCLVDHIALTVQNATDTSVSVAKGSTATLQAVATDTAGNTITPSLQFNDSQTVVGTVGASGTTGTATYSGVAPGYGSVVASCTPPNCNKNASATFSNVVTTTVTNSSSDNGVTANDTNIYVTGTGASQMYPVDSTSFTLGTVISLPFTPNSILMSHDGAHVFLGSDTTAMVVATASNSVSSLGFAGKALAESPNNGYVLFANTKNGVGAVNIMSQSSLTVANLGGFTIPNVTAAAFTPDGNTAYFSDGSNLYRYRIVGDAGSTPTPLTVSNSGGSPLLGGTAKDIATSANGTILFSATTPNVIADETCNASNGTQYFTAFESLGAKSFTAPSALAAIPNGSGMLAVDGTHLDQVTITSPNPLTTPYSGCPANPFSMTPSTISLSALGSGFTVNKLVMSHSGHYAAVLTGCSGCTANVGIVDLTNGTVSTVALTNKAGGTLSQVYSGDFMLDDSGLWVGASDGYIHFVDVATLSDTHQVQVQIQGPTSGSTPNYVDPSLVAIQPK